MALERWFHGDIETLPEMRVHIDGTPDVPDIVRPGDWLALTDEIGDVFVLVVKTEKHQEGEWDICPGAESWTITYLGRGYLTDEKLSSHDCGFINGIVAEDGRLEQLYKLGWNEEMKIRVVQKPDKIEVPKSAESLIKRMNSRAVPQPASYSMQLSLFADTLIG